MMRTTVICWPRMLVSFEVDLGSVDVSPWTWIIVELYLSGLHGGKSRGLEYLGECCQALS